METFKIALTIALALFLQMFLPLFLGFFKFIDLPLIITVYFALQRRPILGMTIGVISGLGGDAVAGGILGVGGFAKTLVGYLVAITSVKVSLENPLARLAAVAVASAANTVLFAGLYLLLRQGQTVGAVLPNTGTWAELGRTIGYKALGDTITALALFLALDRIFAEQTTARRMAIKRRFYE